MKQSNEVNLVLCFIVVKYILHTCAGSKPALGFWAAPLSLPATMTSKAVSCPSMSTSNVDVAITPSGHCAVTVGVHRDISNM